MQESQLTPEEYENKLKEKDQELESLKIKIAGLENEVSQAQKIKGQRSKEHEEVAALKQQSEGILTKAKSIIFENTKVIKNQELQIEALGQQNESLKDVIQITKDLLEIRNLEVKQLENKINAMEGKVKAEKERQDLMHKKLENMIRHNGELKREYEAQLCLFSALRERYNERELAQDVVDNLKQELKDEKAEQSKNNEKANQESVSSAETKSEAETQPETEIKLEAETKADTEIKAEAEVQPAATEQHIKKEEPQKEENIEAPKSDAPN